MRPIAAALVASLAFAPPADEPARTEGPPSAEEPIGGYWGLSERRPPEPKDGRTELFIGAALFPLGLLRAGAGIATSWVSRPAGCPELAEKYDADEADCASLYAYGFYGIAFGGLMAVTGAVLLGIGGHRAKKHAEWEEAAGYRARVAPSFRSARGSFLLGVDLRF
jgi:hypothetical protein